MITCPTTLALKHSVHLLRVFFFLSIFSLPLHAIELYVSTDGNDQSSGSIGEPLKTLEGARDVLRKRRGQNLETATVYIRGGVYSLPCTFEIGAEDSCVRYCAYKKEKAILTGCRPITNFTPYKGQILKADTWSQGFNETYFRDLYFHGKRQVLARYPNLDPENPYHGGWAYIDKFKSAAIENKLMLHFKSADARKWAHPEEGEVWIFPHHNYWNRISQIQSIDTAGHTISLSKEGWDDWEEIQPNDRYFVRNFLEELDTPGEWYLEKKTGVLYFWPPEALNNEPVYAPILDTLVRISPGTKDVTFSGLTFEGADGTGIVLKDTINCLITASTIRNMGGSSSSSEKGGYGIGVEGGKNNGIRGCDVYETGSNGISLQGGDRITLTESGQFAENNYIHHVGVYYKQGVGINIRGCGIRASNNLIHDGPRMGIMFHGNLHVIEYNHIRHMNLETEDTGAIYSTGVDWIGTRGTVIRYNYVHDMLGYGQDDEGAWKFPYYSRGIYLDDFSCGIDVIGNIVARCSDACLMLHCASGNIVKNNIFVSGKEQQVYYQGHLQKDSYWTEGLPGLLAGYNSVRNQPAWKKMRFMDFPPDKAPLSDGKLMQDNIFTQNIIYFNADSSILYRMESISPEHNAFDSNLIWNHGPKHFMTIESYSDNIYERPRDDKYWEAWLAKGLEKNTLIEKPLFVNPDKDDYHLKSESPAFRLGFKQIPIERIGPYEEPSRASWPIKEAVGIREVMERKGISPFEFKK